MKQTTGKNDECSTVIFRAESAGRLPAFSKSRHRLAAFGQESMLVQHATQTLASLHYTGLSNVTRFRVD